MSRYIDADIAKEKLKEYCIDDDNTVRYWYDLMGIDDCIDKIIPTADVRENVKGEWQITDAYPHNVYCSNCHKRFAQTHWAVWEDGSLPRNYCPNCGADMRADMRGEA